MNHCSRAAAPGRCPRESSSRPSARSPPPHTTPRAPSGPRVPGARMAPARAPRRAARPVRRGARDARAERGGRGRPDARAPRHPRRAPDPLRRAHLRRAPEREGRGRGRRRPERRRGAVVRVQPRDGRAHGARGRDAARRPRTEPARVPSPPPLGMPPSISRKDRSLTSLSNPAPRLSLSSPARRPSSSQAEVLKLLFSASVFAHAARAKAERSHRSWRDAILDDLREAFREHRYARFAIPALIYLVENHLRFVVLRRLASPITWVVFSHVEIPIVAVLSYAILRRPLGRVQWIAIAMLLDGVMSAELGCAASRSQRKPPARSRRKNCGAFDAYPIAALSLVLLGAPCGARGDQRGVRTRAISGRASTSRTRSCTPSARRRTFGISRGGANGESARRTGRRRRRDRRRVVSRLRPRDVVGRAHARGVRIVSSLIMKHLSNIAKVFNSAAGMVLVTTLSWAFLGTRVNLPCARGRRRRRESVALLRQQGKNPRGGSSGPVERRLDEAGGGGGMVGGGAAGVAEARRRRSSCCEYGVSRDDDGFAFYC